MNNEVLCNITKYNKGCEFHRVIFSHKDEKNRINERSLPRIIKGDNISFFPPLFDSINKNIKDERVCFFHL